MGNPLERTELLLGKEKVDHLKRCHVAVFGLGGVGSYAVEALARTGVGALTVIDCDVFSESNLNRQLCATVDTVGRRKTDVTKERIAAVAPQCRVTAVDLFYTPDNGDSIDLTQFDYIIDAIDTVTSKIDLICRATAANIPIISSMGTGNKLDPEKLQIADISKTSVCPLARVMRRELRLRGINHLPVLFSTEDPVKVSQRTPASISFVPSVGGLLIAGYVVRELIKT